MFILHNMGIDICHVGDFCIDRPNGSGDWLMIIFKTQARLTLHGEERIVPSESAVIFQKGTPQLYKTICENYVNHFLHFRFDKKSDAEGIVFDQLLYPKDLSEVENLLHMIGRESISDSPNRANYLSMLIRMLLLKLSEQTQIPERDRMSEHSHKLYRLRADLYNNPAKYHSVAQLAEAVGFSGSHFQQLYKKEFGIRCYEDLLIARIKTAQYYLGETQLSIHEIAQLCGYENVTCFLHRFKARIGMTPTEYRNAASH